MCKTKFRSIQFEIISGDIKLQSRLPDLVKTPLIDEQIEDHTAAGINHWEGNEPAYQLRGNPNFVYGLWSWLLYN